MEREIPSRTKTPKPKDASPISPSPMEGNHPLGHQWLEASPHTAWSRTCGHHSGLVMAPSQNTTPNEPPLRSFWQWERQQGPRNLTVRTAFRWIAELRGNLLGHLEYIHFMACFISQTGTLKQLSSSRAARPHGWAAVCAFSPSRTGMTKGLGRQS